MLASALRHLPLAQNAPSHRAEARFPLFRCRPRAVDGHDIAAVDAAIRAAHAATSKPSLICCKTVIAKGAPSKAGTADAHGAALGEKEVAATREALGWSHPPFEIPADVYAGFDARARGARLSGEWAARIS